jgi:multiple sugar transport system permease protein
MKKKTSKKSPVGKWLGWAALAVLAIISIGPIWIAFKTALSGPTAWLSSTGSLVPHETTLFNFQRVLGFVDASDPRITQTGMAKINFFRALLNSVIFTALAVVPQIFFSATAAYAFARLKFPGRDLLFFMFIAATMIPGAVLFIPNFILIKDLGWLNTFQGMAALSALMPPFAVFYLR